MEFSASATLLAQYLALGAGTVSLDGAVAFLEEAA
jgi:hypothetical protein